MQLPYIPTGWHQARESNKKLMLSSETDSPASEQKVTHMDPQRAGVTHKVARAGADIACLYPSFPVAAMFASITPNKHHKVI